MFERTMLQGRSALVTGSTSGIGAKTAFLLARSGASHVFLNGRDVEAGERLRATFAAELPDTKFVFIRGDYSVPADVANIFATIDAECQGLDILVHTCMALGRTARPFMETDRDYWNDAVNGIFLSLLECAKHAVPLMRKRGGGSIVTFASDAAKVATPLESVLGGALAAQVMFARTLAMELGRENIRVNAVTPSLTTDTKSYTKVMAGEYSRRIFEKIAKKAKIGVPSASDVAPLAVFLASPLASHLTGQAISVNGGITAA